MRISRSLDCIVAGDANADLLVEGIGKLEFNKEIVVADMNLVLGGSSAITAFNLACLGARVGFVGAVGDDLLGEFVEERLRRAAVDLSHLRKLPKRKSGLTIWHSNGKSRAGVTYPGTIASLHARDVRSEYLTQARHLHIGAFFLQAGLHKGAAGLFKRARRLGLTTSLDCNYDPLEQWDSGIWNVLAETDVFLPNRTEALRLTGSTRVEAAMRKLAAVVKTVIVKCGGDGALVAQGGTIVRLPALQTELVDGTGAGDSFNAGFLSRFTKGASIGESAAAGLEAGALAVAQVGGTAAFEALLPRRRSASTISRNG